jgi:hypothetical protein
MDQAETEQTLILHPHPTTMNLEERERQTLSNESTGLSKLENKESNIHSSKLVDLFTKSIWKYLDHTLDDLDARNRLLHTNRVPARIAKLS